MISHAARAVSTAVSLDLRGGDVHVPSKRRGLVALYRPRPRPLASSTTFPVRTKRRASSFLASCATMSTRPPRSPRRALSRAPLRRRRPLALRRPFRLQSAATLRNPRPPNRQRCGMLRNVPGHCEEPRVLGSAAARRGGSSPPRAHHVSSSREWTARVRVSPQQRDHFFLTRREAVGPQLREHQRTVLEHLERTTGAMHQLGLGARRGFDLRRQPGSARLVASVRAVFDSDVHRAFFLARRPGSGNPRG
jgi:hypothetical protein